jgi:hypothetical protein
MKQGDLTRSQGKETKVDKLTRRGLIKQTSVGAATIGALMTVPGMAAAHAAPMVRGTGRSSGTLQGPLVAHVRDASTGEIALMVGTREVIVHDPALVRRLIRAVQ